MATSDGKIRIQVFGTFRVMDPHGRDVTPNSRKACGLLALLALSPDHRRTRCWLQDKLWGTRGREQGAASLRQCLVEIRQALGESRCALVADYQFVKLSSEHASIGRPDPDMNLDLLEGFDVGREDEFEDWLREQRANISRGRTASLETSSVAIASRTDAKADRVILCSSGEGRHPESGHADRLLDISEKGLKNWGLTSVIDARGMPEADVTGVSGLARHGDLLLRTEANAFRPDCLRLLVVEWPSRELIWSDAVDVAAYGEPAAAELACSVQAATSTHVIIARLAHRRRLACNHEQTPGVANQRNRALQMAFVSDPPDYLDAERLLEQAGTGQLAAVIDAWRAVILTLISRDASVLRRADLQQAALLLARQAELVDRHNALVLALGVWVRCQIEGASQSAEDKGDDALRFMRQRADGVACEIDRGRDARGPCSASDSLAVARRMAGSSIIGDALRQLTGAPSPHPRKKDDAPIHEAMLMTLKERFRVATAVHQDRRALNLIRPHGHRLTRAIRTSARRCGMSERRGQPGDRAFRVRQRP